MFGTIEGEISRHVNVDLTSALQAPFQTLAGQMHPSPTARMCRSVMTTTTGMMTIERIMPTPPTGMMTISSSLSPGQSQDSHDRRIHLEPSQYKKVPLDQGGYTMDHLMDKEGRFVSPFSLKRTAEAAAADLHRYL
jgi:hypothetical protein